ncbi:MAG: FAD-binding oxidoreductase, partial [Chloroflexota bacterium]
MKSNGSILSIQRLSRLENFGHSLSGPAYLYRPTHPEQIADLFKHATKQGVTVGLRGAGRSYGDASLNSGQVVLDFQRMNRILSWDRESGLVKLEPGVTIEQIWNYTLEDGWWPPVVPGTMFPTIAGCLGSNVHGKNNWNAGTLGEHVLECEILMPTGKIFTCSPTKEKELFYAAIGGIGMLGVFTSITLQMKKIYSGDLNVFAWTEPNLQQSLNAIDQEKENDYVVGWIDSTSSGKGLGRSQLHTANYFAEGEDAAPAQSLKTEHQSLPDTIVGLLPKSMVWRLMRPWMNNLGVRLGNNGKYMFSRTLGNQKHFQQSIAAFNFLLDYVPNWERSYGQGGLIQYQSFIPTPNSHDVFAEMIRLSKKRHLPSYLGVVKRHRTDKFLLSHGVDGFSLALDFQVTRNNRGR